MSHDRWRLFVAIPLGEALRADLGAAVDAWRADGDLAGLRWTDPATWHVTLAFLGSIEPGAIRDLRERLEGVAARHATMRTSTNGLGAFPTGRRGRVAWVGIEDVEGRLAGLAADVAAALGLEVSPPYHPHVTLARARRQAVDLRAWLASASAPGGVLAVDRMELMRSHAGAGVARHETLAAITLGVPVHV